MAIWYRIEDLHRGRVEIGSDLRLDRIKVDEAGRVLITGLDFAMDRDELKHFGDWRRFADLVRKLFFRFFAVNEIAAMPPYAREFLMVFYEFMDKPDANFEGNQIMNTKDCIILLLFFNVSSNNW